MLRCINRGNFNSITVDNNYAISTETADYYYIVNDRNLRARYGKRYFRLIEDAVVPPPAPVRILAQNIADVSVYLERDNLIVSVRDTDILTVARARFQGTIVGTALGPYSGVISFRTLPNILMDLDANIERLLVEMSPEVREHIINGMIALIIEETITNLAEEKTLLFCNVTNSPEDLLLTRVMDSLETIDDVECIVDEYETGVNRSVLVMNLLSEFDGDQVGEVERIEEGILPF
jgi:hypothetical protein